MPRKPGGPKRNRVGEAHEQAILRRAKTIAREELEAKRAKPRVMTPEEEKADRKRERERLRRRAQRAEAKRLADEEAAARGEVRPVTKKNRTRFCKGLNNRGSPCGAVPLRKGTELDGVVVSGDWCIMHDPDIPSSTWRRFQQSGVEAWSVGKRPRPFEIAARAFELAPKLLLRPYLDALGLDIDDETGELIDKGDGGLRLHGFSRDGRVRRSRYPDLEAQVRIAEKFTERFYGKPRQALDIEGGGSTTNVVVIPQTPERAFTVAQVLLESGAISNPADFVEADSVEVEDEDAA